MKFFVLFALCLLFLVMTSAAVLKPNAKKCHAKELETFAWEIMFPGTKWCGDGDIAEDYDDLGTLIEMDKCCREHDHCDDIIPAGGTKHGLINAGLFARSHCKCDLTLYGCLGDASCVAADILATGYFNILGWQCFDLKYPATCVEYHDVLGLRPRCIKYDYDETKPEEWQWFDVPRWIFGPECSNA